MKLRGGDGRERRKGTGKILLISLHACKLYKAKQMNFSYLKMETFWSALVKRQ